MTGEERPRLVRRLSLVETIAVALGAMIGAGAYVSIGEAAGTTGASVIFAVLIGAGVAALNGLSSAELGVDDPQAGGAYQFARVLIRPVAGFVAGWLFLLAGLAAGATFALTFAAYLEPVLPGIPSRFIGLAFVLAALAVNALGVRPSAKINSALVVANLVVLVVFVVLALPALQARNFQPLFTGGVSGLLQASALLFFAYSGYARPVTVAEEVQEPRKTLPRAVTAALSVTTLLYLGIAFAALGALGPESMGRETAPLRAAMTAAGNPIGPILLSVGALIATSTVLLTEIWGLSRLAFAMGRNGDLPGWLSRLSTPERIPRNAILASGAMLLVLTALLDLRPALEASSLALLVYYWFMNLSALRLPPGRRLYPAAIPAIGLVANALLALSLPWQTLLIVFAMAVTGLVYYKFHHRGPRFG